MYGMNDAYSGMAQGLRKARKKLRAAHKLYMKLHVAAGSDEADAMIREFRKVEQAIVNSYDSWGGETKKGVDGKPIKPEWSH